jgi:hypothetical protein
MHGEQNIKIKDLYSLYGRLDGLQRSVWMGTENFSPAGI